MPAVERSQGIGHSSRFVDRNEAQSLRAGAGNRRIISPVLGGIRLISVKWQITSRPETGLLVDLRSGNFDCHDRRKLVKFKDVPPSLRGRFNSRFRAKGFK